MGVYIKDMKMPESCAKCRLARGCQAINDRVARMDKHPWTPRDHRHEDCPLVPVPPHGRLIDADAILQEATKGEEPVDWIDKNELLRLFFDAPTILEAEEVKES